MHPVTSSNLAAIGYDEDSETLQIEFLNNTTYQYFDVPAHIFSDLLNADSAGGYLAKHIKGHYRYSRV
ncbi:KTSC domain-containing protein [Thalassospira povalilytica]|uniref:KTSC domain-containing protein n=1 Tax=Thalassospira povalilytica TaxID=732237 RepID=UPI001D1853C0|nr:KTSC domain-containing protein [Thalassospira povalilytica]MCC4242751.1 KTSC domain-containing protein [Thalassospira povalilytica]